MFAVRLALAAMQLLWWIHHVNQTQTEHPARTNGEFLAGCRHSFCGQLVS